MIILVSYKVVFDKCKNPILAQKKYVAKWPNDFDFGFDITNPVEFRKFLSNYRLKNGKLLPHLSKCGDRIVYKAYTWGTPNWFKELFPEHLRHKRVFCLFPGMDEKGSTLNIIKYGHIRK